MSKLGGYRTIIVAIVIYFFGTFEPDVAPGVIAQYGDVILQGVAIVMIGLRLITNGPVFGVVAADLGVPANDVAAIKSAVAALPDLGAIGPAVAGLDAKLTALTGHPIFGSKILGALESLVSPINLPPAASPSPPSAAAQPQDDDPHAVARMEGEGPGVAAIAAKASVIGAVLFLPLLLAGCAGSVIAPPAPKTPAQAVFEAKAALVAAEDVALAYAGQVCPIAATCQDQRVAGIVQAMNAADAVIRLSETTVRTKGPEDAAQAAADAAAALNQFRATLIAFGVTLPASSS